MNAIIGTCHHLILFNFPIFMKNRLKIIPSIKLNKT
nr:MAG TPA: hypothetical protein [Caudoviricetes sp.]